MEQKNEERYWWKEAVVYQIYPRSFCDSNGDGVGDLQGIISKLGYLHWLGVGAIWLCPFYPSPKVDNGYDISNYFGVDPEYGTMEDFKQLVEQAHALQIRIVVDMVLNHTSNEHAWFIKARSSKNSEDHDDYIWRDGSPETPPNNWASFFEPGAWEYSEECKQWYLHLFASKMPDLNWESMRLRTKIYEMMKQWRGLGVDGFRLDVVSCFAKTCGLPDVQPVDGATHFAGQYFMNRPRVHDYLKEMRQAVFPSPDFMTVGEAQGVDTQTAALYCDARRQELSMIFQFELMELDSGPLCKWEIVQFDFLQMKAIFFAWQTQLPTGWNSLFWSNHDQPRSISRFLNPPKALEQRCAKLLALSLHLQRGTPYVYQGEELGMSNMPFESKDQLRDYESLCFLRDAQKQYGFDEETAWRAVLKKGRDNARTPMQWDNSPYAGFSACEPWIVVNPNYKQVNAKAQAEDPASVLLFYRRLIALRKTTPLVVYGYTVPLLQSHTAVFAYLRVWEEQQWLVLANFSAQTIALERLGLPARGGLVLTNIGQETNPDCLLPYEATVYRVE